MKVILIGIDSATWDQMLPWVRQGHLPAIRTMMRRGMHGKNRTTIPPVSIPAIPSMYTGKNPGKLGVFSFQRPDGSVVNSLDIREKAIWDHIGERGFRSAIINLTSTYPAKEMNGILITGQIIPRIDEGATHPSELRHSLGDFPVGEGWADGMDWSDPEHGLERTMEVTQRRFDKSKEIIKEGDYDFSLFWIIGSDPLNHLYNNRNDILLKYYMMIDSNIKEWMETFKEHNFLVISDHGGDPAPMNIFHINSWLHKEGYLAFKGGSLGRGLLSLLMRTTPSKIKKGYARRSLKKKQTEGRLSQALPGTDWERTIAFKDSLGISLHGKGAGRRYDELREEIINKLLSLEHGKGNKVVKEAWKREQLYSGPHVDKVPDIVLLPGKDFAISSDLSKEIISYQGVKIVNGFPATGAHNSATEGIFMAFGPDIKRGKADINILDITPTLLHMFGLPIPEDLDGRVLKEIFKPDSSPGKGPVSFKEKDEESVISKGIERLRLDRKI